MTVRELIAELSKYPPDAEVTLETCDNSVCINHVAFAGRVQIFGEDDDEDDEDDEEEYGDEAYDSFDDEDEEDDGE